MSTNFYALGHRDNNDPMYHIGKMSNSVFTWAMNRARLEAVLAGSADKHCDTCTCNAGPDEDGSVAEDENGTRYTHLQLALVFAEATSEDRSLEGRVFF